MRYLIIKIREDKTFHSRSEIIYQLFYQARVNASGGIFLAEDIVTSQCSLEVLQSPSLMAIIKLLASLLYEAFEGLCEVPSIHKLHEGETSWQLG